MGGTIKSGLIEYTGTEKDFVNYLNKIELIDSNKFSYGIFGQDENEILRIILKVTNKKQF